MDRIYVIRTSVSKQELEAEVAVDAYKSLGTVERVFRTENTDLTVRPIHHHAPDCGTGSCLLCMLAYYVHWHTSCGEHWRRRYSTNMTDRPQRVHGARAATALSPETLQAALPKNLD